MSARDTLKSTLPPDVHDDIDEVFQDQSDPDPRDVVADLHRKGVLDAGQLKDAVVALESRERIRHVSRSIPEMMQPEVMGQLGEGAMGEVLIAKDPGLGRVVAVKRIHPDAARNKAMMHRFYTEAQVTAQLDHPSIVPIHGLFKDDAGGLSYAMKLVRGRTLEEYLDEASENPDDPDHTLQARLERFLHVCDAMSYAHERGILHRDLKPENIMVGAFGEVLVMDWGIAKILAHRDDPVAEADPAEQPKSRKGTRVGQIMGTPRYMSPEQADGRNDIIDARSDQYALGLILQEVVTLVPAMSTDLQLEAILGWAQQGRRLPMKGANRELAAIVKKACSVDMDQRYPSVRALSNDIRRHLRDEPIEALPDGLVARILRWIGRHRRAAMIMIVCLGLSVVVGGSGLVALGGGALAMQTWQASQREAALTNVLHTAMSRAASVDASFHNIEGLTTSMAYAARASTHTAPRKLPYKVAQAEPARKHDTGRHGRASVDYASVGTRVGSERNETDLSRMANLGSVMTQAMVSVQTRDARKIDGADRAKRIGDAEAPITWVKIGLVNGTLGRAPGTTAYDPRLSDFKAEPWFTAPKKRRGASWGEPTMDPLGLGQVVPCSVAWFTNNGAIEGVAAMEVSVHWMKKRISSFKGATVYLIDKENRVMVSTKTDATRKPTFETLPAPQHIEAITHDQAGWHEASDGSLAVWSPMKTTGWTWVAIAPSKMLRARVNSTH